MKLHTKADRYSSAETEADSEQKDQDMFVSPDIAKPNVADAQLSSKKIIY